MSKLLTTTLYTLLIFIVFIPRIIGLDTVRSPDEKRWVANTTGFTRKLAHGQWDDLVQQPHPGITTQWIGAIAIHQSDWHYKKLPLAITQGLLILAAGYIFSRLWNKTAGLFLILLLVFNPLLYAHTRVFAMDSLLALFSLLSIGLLLLWKKKLSHRYLIAAAFTGAAAFLSKLPGIIILPFTTLLFFWWFIKSSNKKIIIKHFFFWLIALIISASLILPSIPLNPDGVFNSFGELFRSDEYHSKHQGELTYYLRSLTFFSTPSHLLLLLAIPLLALNKSLRKLDKHSLLILTIFGALFAIQMTIGAKKGDRYILPTFLTLDAMAALIFAWLFTNRLKKKVFHITYLLFITVVIWQAGIIWKNPAHSLAYINPITRPLFENRRHGWGEGLDLAAQYLNQKQNAESLKVATFYPNEFSHYFVGETIPVHQHDDGNPDYVILYRAMLERGPDAWETDVLNQYQDQSPEKIIQLSGLDFVWIYQKFD